jgi:peptidoglycan/LPS O-acetylase OafA/YrhL
MIWCQYKDKIDNQIKNKYIISLLIAIVLFAFSIAIKFFGDHFNCYGVELFGNIISVPFFITLVLIALNKVQINNKITNFLGKISLEIYLIHGNIIRLLSKFDMFVNNILLFFVVAVALFVLLAFIANLIDKKLLKWFIKLTIKKDKDLTKI